MDAITTQLYAGVQQAGGIKSGDTPVAPGDVYFHLSPNRPAGRLRRRLWHFFDWYLPDTARLGRWLPAGSGRAAVRRAVNAGASLVISDNPFSRRQPRCQVVPNSQQTLLQLAAYHRQQFDIPCLVISGSNGKTTTRALLAAVLGTRFRLVTTPENQNNLRGIPETLLAIDETTEMAILEVGVVRAGSLGQLCRLIQPTHGLLTGIGQAHLATFGDLAGVQKAKGELFDYLVEHDGWLFRNLNDPRVRALVPDARRQVTYGAEPAALARVALLAAAPFLAVRWQRAGEPAVDIQTGLVGAHNLDNAAAAVAVGDHFGVAPAQIAAALAAYRPANNRSQLIVRGSNTFFLDAYNANPTSMTAALHSFAQYPAAARVAILGEMLELGRHSRQAHADIIGLARQLPLTQVVFVGREFARVQDTAFGLYLPSAAAARLWFQQQRFQDSHILLKGSRGVALEHILA